MIVKELIAELSKCNHEALVVMSRDAEGNGHSVLFSLWDGVYDANTGAVGLKQLTSKDIQLGFSQKDVITGADAVVLTPRH